jgi:hypothetical protein
MDMNSSKRHFFSICHVSRYHRVESEHCTLHHNLTMYLQSHDDKTGRKTCAHRECLYTNHPRQQVPKDLPKVRKSDLIDAVYHQPFAPIPTLT